MTLKRKASGTGNANSKCEMCIITASKCGRFTIKVEASNSNKKYSRKCDSSYLDLRFTCAVGKVN